MIIILIQQLTDPISDIAPAKNTVEIYYVFTSKNQQLWLFYR